MPRWHCSHRMTTDQTDASSRGPTLSAMLLAVHSSRPVAWYMWHVWRTTIIRGTGCGMACVQPVAQPVPWPLSRRLRSAAGPVLPAFNHSGCRDSGLQSFEFLHMCACPCVRVCVRACVRAWGGRGGHTRACARTLALVHACAQGCTRATDSAQAVPDGKTARLCPRARAHARVRACVRVHFCACVRARVGVCLWVYGREGRQCVSV